MRKLLLFLLLTTGLNAQLSWNDPVLTISTIDYQVLNGDFRQDIITRDGYNNDCWCDASNPASGSFGVYAGEEYGVGNLLGFNVFDLNGSIFSPGNEAYAEIHTRTGAFIPVGTHVYDNNGRYITAGTYIRNNRITTSDSGTGACPCTLQSETFWVYVIGNNGIVQSITEQEHIIDDIAGSWSDWSPLFNTQTSGFTQTRTRSVIVIGRNDNLPTTENREISVTLGGYNEVVMESIARIDFNEDGDLLDSRSVLTRTYTARTPDGEMYGFHEIDSEPILNNVSPITPITGTIRPYSGPTFPTRNFRVISGTSPQGQNLSMSHGVFNFTGGGFYEFVVGYQIRSTTSCCSFINRSSTVRILVSDNGNYDLRLDATYSREYNGRTFVSGAIPVLENSDPNYVRPTGIVRIGFSSTSGDFHIESVTGPFGSDIPVIDGLSFTYAGAGEYHVTVGGTNSRGQTFSGWDRRFIINTTGNYTYLFGSAGGQLLRD